MLYGAREQQQPMASSQLQPLSVGHASMCLPAQMPSSVITYLRRLIIIALTISLIYYYSALATMIYSGMEIIVRIDP